MALMSIDGLDGLIGSMAELASLPADVQNTILDAQADIYLDAQKRKGLSYGVHRTGVTLSSITKGKPHRGHYTQVQDITFQGVNAQGRRNAEVAFINNYGKRNQKARPFVTDANNESSDAALKAAEDAYSDWLKSKNL